MGWLRVVGSLKLQVSFAEYSLFYRALLQKRHIILRSLLIAATPYVKIDMRKFVSVYVCASVCVCVHACVSVWGGWGGVCACVRACVCVYMLLCIHMPGMHYVFKHCTCERVGGQQICPCFTIYIYVCMCHIYT